jgi:CheY-like chemotaxis protein
MPDEALDVLIVDDDMDMPDIIADLLQSQGHNVRVANDGEEGLKMLHDELPDVVVLDVEMPRLTGPEMVYRMIIEDSGLEGIPVLLVSGVVGLEGVASPTSWVSRSSSTNCFPRCSTPRAKEDRRPRTGGYDHRAAELNAIV